MSIFDVVRSVASLLCAYVNQLLFLVEFVVPEKSNAIIGVVTAGFECLPPSCDGLMVPDDHGPMISTGRLALRACTRRLMDFITNGFSSKSWSEQFRQGGGGGEALEEKGVAVSSTLGLGFCVVSKVFRTFENHPPMLNTLSSVSVRESRIQYLCDPQWFRDTASRGPTTIVAPKSQFRTCPTDHDNIGYPRMSVSGESSITMHRLLHASGPHPIPPPNDPKGTMVRQPCTHPSWIPLLSKP
ncbi:hypothetical protein F511_27316 [Dorcoceras hygrometricum]|uniref:Uncharacterized protein n=1 Tax=Dorcoceras hygrometricum TaxID=472368 RepID=A0A2Z7D957_9LAMI|nr:hypothetical protein F511_27316 [Dorcoceras hygrometricum]